MYLYLLIFVCGSFNCIFVAADNDGGNIPTKVPVVDPKADCVECVTKGKSYCPIAEKCDVENCTDPIKDCSPVTPDNTTTSPSTSSTLPTVSSTNPTDLTTATTTPVPSPTVATVAPNGRHFDPPSFIGGIVLALGLLAIIYVSFKFYKARTERNYHIL